MVTLKGLATPSFYQQRPSSGGRLDGGEMTTAMPRFTAWSVVRRRCGARYHSVCYLRPCNAGHNSDLISVGNLTRLKVLLLRIQMKALKKADLLALITL